MNFSDDKKANKDDKDHEKTSEIKGISKVDDHGKKPNDKKTDKSDEKSGMFFRMFFKVLGK